uniref:Uncharacterized protein n=1 Tax=Panagrolaimus sp. JU765 TaxID=591449 RepID=A0AC34RJQ3_9BILA
MISKLNEKNLEDEKIKIYGEQYLKKPKNYQTNEKIIGDSKARAAKEIQLDEPIPISSGFNVDHSFSSVPKEMKLPPMDNEWKSTLFGPKGLLTEVFHFVNEKRKQGFEKPLPQSDLPPGPTSEVDFAKVFDAILLKSGNGEFNEPKIPELPFIGICNRLNCGDIYKYVDQFKKSELFSNFQTALSLFQDPKGLDIIGELLENPDLIEQFAGKPENIAELLGKAGGPAKSKSGSKSHSMSVLPSDGDLGIDFGRELEPEKYAKKDGKPEFAASIDGGDYYSSVDKEPKKSSVDVDYEDTESVEVEESIVSTTTTLIPNDTRKKFERPLPELSFSVDETPKIGESVDEKLPEYGSRIEIEETAPVLTFKNATTRRNFRKNNDYYAMYYDD